MMGSPPKAEAVQSPVVPSLVIPQSFTLRRPIEKDHGQESAVRGYSHEKPQGVKETPKEGLNLRGDESD